MATVVAVVFLIIVVSVRSARRQRIGYCFLNCDWSQF